jgi:predicted acetyltransferase
VASIEIVEAAVGDKPVLQQLFELYQYDFTEFDGVDVDEHGRFGSAFLDRYWEEDGRYPYLLRVGGRLAGAALVHAGEVTDMAEFFVMRKYRRAGVGMQFARDLFNRFPGPWNVREIATNAPAQAFWRRVIPVPFEEVEWERGPMQRFTMP